MNLQVRCRHFNKVHSWDQTSVCPVQCPALCNFMSCPVEEDEEVHVLLVDCCDMSNNMSFMSCYKHKKKRCLIYCYRTYIGCPENLKY